MNGRYDLCMTHMQEIYKTRGNIMKHLIFDFDGTLEMVPIATEEESGEQESGDNL